MAFWHADFGGPVVLLSSGLVLVACGVDIVICMTMTRSLGEVFVRSAQIAIARNAHEVGVSKMSICYVCTHVRMSISLSSDTTVTAIVCLQQCGSKKCQKVGMPNMLADPFVVQDM